MEEMLNKNGNDDIMEGPYAGSATPWLAIGGGQATPLAK
jgi:hypothetical protein